MSALPPRRDLPDDVRERLRTRVMGDQPGRSRSRGLLAAAAAAVLVAAGLTLSTSFDRDPGPRPADPTTAPGPEVPLTPSPGEAELDRCWAALVDAGKTDGYPDRSEWRAVVSSRNVTAAWAGDKPIICATTPTHVSVSGPKATPQYVGDSGTGILLRTSSGVVAGVVDPGWPAVEVAYQYPDGAYNGGAAAQAEGLFVFSSLENQLDARLDLRLRRTEDPSSTLNGPNPPPFGGSMVSPGPTPVTVYDRQGEPGEQDQSALEQCLRAADVPDVGNWRVGATWLGRVGGRVLGGGGTLGRDGDRVVVCDGQVTPGPDSVIDLGDHPPPPADAPPIRLQADLSYPTIIGLVSPDAAYVAIYFGDLTLLTPVVNSTFAMEDVKPVVEIKVFDRDHNVLYVGPFAEGDS